VDLNVWHTSRLARVFGYIGLALGVAGIVVGVIMLGVARNVILGVSLTVTGPMLFMYGWRYGLRPCIVANDEGLIVRNPWRLYHLSWSDILDIQPGYSGLVIKTRWGEIDAWAVQRAEIATWIGKRTRSDNIAEEIRVLATEKRTEHAPDWPFP
jgi:Bacterial PH domain